MKKKKEIKAEVVKPEAVETAIVKFKNITVKVTVKNDEAEMEVILWLFLISFLIQIFMN